MVNQAAGRLVYPSPGVLIQEKEFDDPQPIVFAYRSAPDAISMRMMSGEDSPYTIDPNTLQSYSAGLVKFQDSRGTAFQIRPLADTDGEWLSRYQTTVPAQALSNLVSGYNSTGSTEGSAMSAYLNDQRETMVAFQFPGDDYLFGLLYINRFGAYIRMDGSWVMVPHNDDTFDETYPYYVNPSTVDDFLAAWDQGSVAVDDALGSNWVARPDDQSVPDPTPAPADDQQDTPDDGQDQVDEAPAPDVTDGSDNQSPEEVQ